MGREDVHREMRETLGTVLFSFAWIPDELVDSEWDLVKRLQVARDFGQGIQTEQSAVQSRQSLRLHDENATRRDSRTIARDVAARESRLRQLEDSNWPEHRAPGTEA